MAPLVAAAMGNRKRLLAGTDAGEFRRKVGYALGDQMHSLSLPLDAAARGHHASRQDGAPVLLEDLAPDNEVGDTGLGQLPPKRRARGKDN